jgi:hypothetical protein
MPGVAFAVDATVTVTNQGTAAMVRSVVSSGEAYTQANVNPTPTSPLLPSASDTFTVGNPASNLVTGVHLRYKIGSKQCLFHSSFTGTPSQLPGGAITPNWTKSVEQSGGAICTATITYTAPSPSFNWNVTFTMK